ncbi:MAG: hypothetical protein A3F67_02885 [Verrucomicrobia bacterium RIFCSPHIGHO2_12_FULL_41_10]|nr:MAG: hypothetical protein A3F67_02885 [Verrucomicrobia bacterium RIFCSPHIGHO2_12_FULL_41_10]
MGCSEDRRSQTSTPETQGDQLTRDLMRNLNLISKIDITKTQTSQLNQFIPVIPAGDESTLWLDYSRGSISIAGKKAAAHQTLKESLDNIFPKEDSDHSSLVAAVFTYYSQGLFRVISTLINSALSALPEKPCWVMANENANTDISYNEEKQRCEVTLTLGSPVVLQEHSVKGPKKYEIPGTITAIFVLDPKRGFKLDTLSASSHRLKKLLCEASFDPCPVESMDSDDEIKLVRCKKELQSLLHCILDLQASLMALGEQRGTEIATFLLEPLLNAIGDFYYRDSNNHYVVRTDDLPFDNHHQIMALCHKIGGFIARLFPYSKNNEEFAQLEKQETELLDPKQEEHHQYCRLLGEAKLAVAQINLLTESEQTKSLIDHAKTFIRFSEQGSENGIIGSNRAPIFDQFLLAANKLISQKDISVSDVLLNFIQRLKNLELLNSIAQKIEGIIREANSGVGVGEQAGADATEQAESGTTEQAGADATEQAGADIIQQAETAATEQTRSTYKFEEKLQALPNKHPSIDLNFKDWDIFYARIGNIPHSLQTLNILVTRAKDILGFIQQPPLFEKKLLLSQLWNGIQTAQSQISTNAEKNGIDLTPLNDLSKQVQAELATTDFSFQLEEAEEAEKDFLIRETAETPTQNPSSLPEDNLNQTPVLRPLKICRDSLVNYLRTEKNISYNTVQPDRLNNTDRKVHLAVRAITLIETITDDPNANYHPDVYAAVINILSEIEKINAETRGQHLKRAFEAIKQIPSSWRNSAALLPLKISNEWKAKFLKKAGNPVSSSQTSSSDSEERELSQRWSQHRQNIRTGACGRRQSQSYDDSFSKFTINKEAELQTLIEKLNAATSHREIDLIMTEFTSKLEALDYNEAEKNFVSISLPTQVKRTIDELQEIKSIVLFADMVEFRGKHRREHAAISSSVDTLSQDHKLRSLLKESIESKLVRAYQAQYDLIAREHSVGEQLKTIQDGFKKISTNISASPFITSIKGLLDDIKAEYTSAVKKVDDTATLYRQGSRKELDLSIITTAKQKLLNNHRQAQREAINHFICRLSFKNKLSVSLRNELSNITCTDETYKHIKEAIELYNGILDQLDPCSKLKNFDELEKDISGFQQVLCSSFKAHEEVIKHICENLKSKILQQWDKELEEQFNLKFKQAEEDKQDVAIAENINAIKNWKPSDEGKHSKNKLHDLKVTAITKLRRQQLDMLATTEVSEDLKLADHKSSITATSCFAAINTPSHELIEQVKALEKEPTPEFIQAVRNLLARAFAEFDLNKDFSSSASASEYPSVAQAYFPYGITHWFSPKLEAILYSESLNEEDKYLLHAARIITARKDINAPIEAQVKSTLFQKIDDFGRIIEFSESMEEAQQPNESTAGQSHNPMLQHVEKVGSKQSGDAEQLPTDKASFRALAEGAGFFESSGRNVHSAPSVPAGVRQKSVKS